MANESRVLIIYCGGTIGMLKSDEQGYVPEPFYLTETLRAQTRFHDPHEDSLFSHSSSVQGFREWTQSGRASPLPAPQANSSPPNVSQLPSLLVRSSRPFTMPRTSGSQEMLSSTKISEDCYEAFLPSLVTPGGNGRKIRYAVHEVGSRLCGLSRNS
jgi:lysophospholipase